MASTGIEPEEIGSSSPRERMNRMSEKDAKEVEDRIASLRQKAENGELGDDLLEDVAGGHTDGVIHVDSPSEI
jgi:hypothetical protein